MKPEIGGGDVLVLGVEVPTTSSSVRMSVKDQPRVLAQFRVNRAVLEIAAPPIAAGVSAFLRAEG